MKIKSAYRFASILLLLTFICACLPAGADGQQTVRVAYFDMGDYYKPAGEAVDSYDTAYLAKIAQYSGLRFEYVNCGTWSQALEMLRRHEVDLVGTAQWSERRDREYEYCMQSYGYSVAELAALPERGFVYEDYAAIGTATIGCTADYVRRRELDALLSAHGISPEIKTYPAQADLESALASGEIDLIAANSHTLLESWTVVEKYAYTSFYFISWKGNTALTDALDDAAIRIQLYEEFFDDELLEQYFPGLLHSPFTREELDLIAEGKTYTVYFDSATKPLVWRDDQSGEMRGVLVDLCALMGKKTGLKLEVRPVSEAPETYDALSVGYHTLFSPSGPQDALSSGGGTDSILDENFSLYHTVGTGYDPARAYTVAVPDNRDGMYRYFEREYPGYTLRLYASPLECLNAVIDGETDLAFVSDYIANNCIIEKNFSTLAALPTTTVKLGIGLQFYGKDAQLLAGLADKAFNLIQSDEINAIKLDYALASTPEITFPYLISRHLLQIGVVAVIIVSLILLISLLLMRNHTIRRESLRVAEADHARADFFSRMSHDMRTPMNGVLGMAILSENETDPAVLRRNMRKVRESGEYLLGLINDTLDLQKIETGKLKLDPQIQPVDELIDSITSMVRVTAEKKHIRFSVVNRGADFGLYILCDPLRIRQIFVNLLSNAVKFTPEGGSVQLIIERLSREGNCLHERVQVIDTGVGMSQDFIDHSLFTAYAQERNAMTAKYAGTGLGLAIARNLVEMMGGRIEAQSRPGEGSAFTVYIDFEVVEAEAARATLQKRENAGAAPAEALHGKQLLLCEDQPLNAEIARRLLERAGCRVVWAQDGRQGVDRFKAAGPDEFDAILMDVRMPVLDGLSAARELRALPRPDAQKIPIIAMTANAYAEDVRQCLEAGMNAHLAKPIEPADLYATLIHALEAAKEP